MYVHIYRCIYIYIYVYAYNNSCVCACLYVCVCVRVCVYVCAHTHIFMYTCTCIWINTYICIYTHTYTNSHIHTPWHTSIHISKYTLTHTHMYTRQSQAFCSTKSHYGMWVWPMSWTQMPRLSSALSVIYLERGEGVRKKERGGGLPDSNASRICMHQYKGIYTFIYICIKYI